jgi:hypothetical protein
MATTLSIFESYGFLPVATPKLLVLQFLLKANSTSFHFTSLHCGCLSGYPQLPPHLKTDAAVHDEKYRGLNWISWKTF